MKYTQIALFLLLSSISFGQEFKEDKLHEKAFDFYNKNILDSALKYDQLSARIYHKSKDSFNFLQRYSEVFFLLTAQNKQAEYTQFEPLIVPYSYFKSPLVPITLNNLGSAYLAKFDYEKAENYFYKGLQNRYIQETERAAIYNNLGFIANMRGDFTKSLTYYNQSMEGFKLLKDTFRVGSVLFNMGQINEMQRNLNGAERYYLEALKLFKIVPIEQIKCYTNLATLNMNDKLSRLDKAEKYINEAIRIQKKNNILHELGRSYKHLGNIYLQKKQYDLATLTLKKAIVERQKINERQGVGLTYAVLAKMLAEQKKYDEALKVFDDGLKYFTKTNNQIPCAKNIQFRYQALELLTDKSNSLAANPKYSSSVLKSLLLADTLIDLMRQEHSEEKSKLFWREKTREIYVNAMKLCFRMGDAEKAFYFMEKSRAVLLLDALRNIGAQNVLSPQLQVQELALKQKIYGIEQKMNSLVSGSKIYGEAMNQLIEAKEEYQRFIKNLSQSNPAYHSLKYATNVVSLDNFKKYLAKNQQSYLGFFSTDSVVYGLAIHSQKVIFKKVLFPNYKATIEQFIVNIQQQRTGFNAEYSVLSHQIYERLIKPFQIPKGQLIVSLDNIFFPVEALLSNPNDPQSFLVKDYAINYIYSANTLLQPHTNQWAFRTMLGVAPVSFQKSLKLSSLVGSDKVLEELSYNNLLSKNLIKTNAKKGEFLDKASDFQILQLFTHGRANNANKGAAIYFADSALYLSELYKRKALNADLVVLSACETGVGETQTGEGIMSMARGFAFVGVPSTITTLWSVSSQETYNLTTYFYELLGQGKPKNVALQEAKLKLIQDNPLPYYWSGMVLIGETEPISSCLSSILLGFIICLIVGFLGYRIWG